MWLSPVSVQFNVATVILFWLLCCLALANCLFSCSATIDLCVVFAAAAAPCAGSVLYTWVVGCAHYRIGSGHSAQCILHALTCYFAGLLREAEIQ